MRTCMLCLLTLAVSVSPAFGQQKPFAPEAPAFDLLSVCQAVYNEGENYLAVRIPQFHAEQREVERVVTEMRIENRTRTVTQDGREVEQAYQVEVPVQERRTVTITVLVPARASVARVAMNRVRGWNLAGEELSPDVLKQRLNRVSPVVLVTSATDGAAGVDPHYASILSRNLVVLFADSESVTRLFEGPAAMPVRCNLTRRRLRIVAASARRPRIAEGTPPSSTSTSITFQRSLGR